MTKQAKWNTVGNILYDEGVAVIKSPHLWAFGQNGFNMEFKADHNVHVMEINVPVESGELNSSSNPQYQQMLASDYASEVDESFVYITSINFHDDNFNIIARSNLSQPIIKRPSERFLFRVKVDF